MMGFLNLANRRCVLVRLKNCFLVLVVFAGALLLGSELTYRLGIAPTKIIGSKTMALWDNTRKESWPPGFDEITMDSGQMAYLYRSPDDGAPLVVSLHTWSGGYDQHDPLAEKAAIMGWNYIHPDFQGPNNSPDACLSEKVIADIDEAITYAIYETGADANNVFIVGVSGGGYAALGYYLQADPRIKKVFSWVPISDLNHWYAQTQRSGTRYARDVLACTGSDGGRLNAEAAKQRSPLRWDIPEANLPDLDIYAGINDGHEGSVPVSHSVLFYNKMVDHFSGGQAETVGPSLMADILTRSVHNDVIDTVEGRSIIYTASYKGVSLTVFEGGHEMLVSHTSDELALTAGVTGASLDNIAGSD